MTRGRSCGSDRRGAGVAEYALLLFIILIIGALVFKYVGGGVKHAGNKTNEQFAGASAGEGDKSSAGGGGAAGGGAAGKSGADKQSGDKGGSAGGQGGGSGGSGQGGAGGAAGAGGGGGGGAGGAQASENGSGGGSGEDEEVVDKRQTPIWKIIGAVFILLFVLGGYFAFRKTKSAG